MLMGAGSALKQCTIIPSRQIFHLDIYSSNLLFSSSKNHSLYHWILNKLKRKSFIFLSRSLLGGTIAELRLDLFSFFIKVINLFYQKLISKQQFVTLFKYYLKVRLFQMQINLIFFVSIIFKINMIESFKESVLYKRIKIQIYTFLLQEKGVHPVYYFAFFLYLHYSIEPISNSFHLVMFAFSMVTALLFNYNFLFVVTPYISGSPIVVLPLLVIGLLSCTQKWKVIIFLFGIGDNIFNKRSQNLYFLVLFSLLVSCQIYRSLVFKNISQNIQYFVAMTAISVYYSLQIVINIIGAQSNSIVSMLLVIFSSSFAFSLINGRIYRLKGTDQNKLYKNIETAHYIKMIEEDMNQPLLVKIRMIFHRRKCENSICFCRNSQYDTCEYFLRQLYENAMHRFKDQADSLLIDYYIDSLIKNDQIISALHFLAHLKIGSYFDLVKYLKAKAKIEFHLNNINSSNIYQNQYTYAIQYDGYYLKMATQINQILKLKLKFWSEVNRQNVKVVKIQKLGYEIIDKMYSLNSYYNKKVKLHQTTIFSFDCTILYSMYMLSTTNFKDYAEIIIKKTAKLLEETYVIDQRSSQTFAIQTTVVNNQKSFLNNIKDHLQQKCNPDRQRNKNNYKIMIQAVSTGLCTSLHLNRKDLINKQLSFIIPNGYKQAHNIRLSYLLNFQSQKIGQIVPSKILHRQIKIPFRGQNGTLLIAYIFVKFHINIDNKLSFTSIVKMVHEKSTNILMDVDGNITEMQEGFNIQILKHSQIRKYLNKLRGTWKRQRIIQQQKFVLMIDSINYQITISSPFLALFADKEQIKQKCPPIHIQILNEDNHRSQNISSIKNDRITKQIQRMEKQINNDVQSTTSSSKGGSSAVNILSNFTNNNVVPIYRFLYIICLLIIVCCVSSNIAAFFVTRLPWDATKVKNNPINDTMNLYSLKMLSTKAIIESTDEFTYFTEGAIFNQTRIAQYFGYSNYLTNMIVLTNDLEFAYHDSILNLLKSPSDFLKEEIRKILQQSLILNSLQFYKKAINATYREMLWLYNTDHNLMQKFNFYNLIILDTFSPAIQNIQNYSYLSGTIDSGINHTQTISIYVNASLGCLIILLLIPLSFILKKRLSYHQKILDLLVSIDPEDVSDQIKSIEYVCNILRNYKQSNEIMKSNVMDYEQNKIHPKSSKKGKRLSLQNGMINGLQKYDCSYVSVNQRLEESSCSQSIKQSRGSSQSFKISLIKKSSAQFNRSGQLDSLIRDKLMDTKQQATVERRKRAGQLDLTNSFLDPSPYRIISKHCLLYILFMSFAFFLLASIFANSSYNSQYKEIKDTLLNIYDEQALFQDKLLKIKAYIVYGTEVILQTYNITDEMPFLNSALSNTPTYNYYNSDTFYSQVIGNCSNSTFPFSSSYIKKYCQYSYSEVILRGQFGALFKQMAQLRYNLDNNFIVNQSANATLTNLKEKFFYLESLNQELQVQVMAKINILLNATLQLSEDYNSKKIILLMSSVSWGVVCFAVGLIIVSSFKKNYLKEVFMITFLNNDMIIKNKRVQSFLQSFARNSYS